MKFSALVLLVAVVAAGCTAHALRFVLDEAGHARHYNVAADGARARKLSSLSPKKPELARKTELRDSGSVLSYQTRADNLFSFICLQWLLPRN
ncbi:MAG: hypothetical protein ACLGP3_00520 [Acidobacteriota bacterium]